MRSIRRLPSSAIAVSSPRDLPQPVWRLRSTTAPLYARGVPPFRDPPLEGALVRLRAREPADAPGLNRMFDDPDVLAGLVMAMPQPLQGFLEWVERTKASSSQVVF